jgi:hypothetical protein
MTPHDIVWNNIKGELFGEVCEVARRVPWGFQADRPSIHNLTCEQFLESKTTFGTVVLHILLGEGEALEVFEKVLNHACKHALKIIIIEHSPSSSDWDGDDNVTFERVDFLHECLNNLGERVRKKDLSRNVLYFLTTVKPLFIDQISDQYVKDNLNKSWEETSIETWYPDGYYTHTSESLISDEIIQQLPKDKDFYWGIGGLMFLGNIPRLPKYKHKLIDIVLKQCLYARIVIEPNSKELISKINTIGGIADKMLARIKNSPMSIAAFGNSDHWKNSYKMFGSEEILEQISSIEHSDMLDLDVRDQVIYTSTIPLKKYAHLKFENWIITCVERVRDVPWLISKATPVVKKEKAIVPKKIFFYWGSPVMSWLRYMTLYSFRKLNPDWEMELHVSNIDKKNKYWYTFECQDFHSYKGKNYLSEVEKLGVKIKECPVFVDGAGPSHNSNFFKWNELATNGGIYADMDYLFVKPIEEFYNSIKKFRTGISYSKDWAWGTHGGHYSISFMFSNGNNSFFKDVYNADLEYYDLDRYQGAGVEPLYLMLERGSGMTPYIDGLYYIPMNVAYPWRCKEQKDLFNLCHTKLPEETIGIHWYAGHPEAQKFNNEINPDTLSNFNNTMSYWLKKIC